MARHFHRIVHLCVVMAVCKMVQSKCDAGNHHLSQRASRPAGQAAYERRISFVLNPLAKPSIDAPALQLPAGVNTCSRGSGLCARGKKQKSSPGGFGFGGGGSRKGQEGKSAHQVVTVVEESVAQEEEEEEEVFGMRISEGKGGELSGGGDDTLLSAVLAGEVDIDSLGLGVDDEMELRALLESVGGEIRQVLPEGVPQGAPQSAGETGMWTASPSALTLEQYRTGTYSEEVEGVPGSVYVHNVLSVDECEAIISVAQRMGFVEHDMVKNFHASVTWVADLDSVIFPLYERLVPFLPARIEGQGGSSREAWGLNARLRVYRYQPDGKQTFRPHTDDSFPMSACVQDRFVWDVSNAMVCSVCGVLFAKGPFHGIHPFSLGKASSLFTLLLYLNDDFEGGFTNFFEPGIEESRGGDVCVPGPLVAAVKPRAGSVLMFPQTGRTKPLDATEIPSSIDKGSVSSGASSPMDDGVLCGLVAPLHEGSPVYPRKGGRPKYIVRSDFMYSFNGSA